VSGCASHQGQGCSGVLHDVGFLYDVLGLVEMVLMLNGLLNGARKKEWTR
jgi:hypothetical protein